MKYLKVIRQQRSIALTLTPEALNHSQSAIVSWVTCLWAQYALNGFSVHIDLGHYRLRNDFEIENAFAQYCESLSPVARTLHVSLLQWAKKPTSDLDDALDTFTEFNRHLESLNLLKPIGKTPKYSVKKQRQGPGVIMTLREDLISMLGADAAILCISALTSAIAREKGGPVGIYNPFTAFKNHPAPDYANFHFWLMTQAFLQYMTDLPWSVAQVKELIPTAITLSGFFENHHLPS